jgi:hypothetical protein
VLDCICPTGGSGRYAVMLAVGVGWIGGQVQLDGSQLCDHLCDPTQTHVHGHQVTDVGNDGHLRHGHQRWPTCQLGMPDSRKTLKRTEKCDQKWN